MKKYESLLRALKDSGYSFQPCCEYSTGTPKTIYLRHDVDLKPGNSLATAHIEHNMGIRATYYFRAVPESWNEKIIKEIAALGHEIGYHYESLTTCAGNLDRAYEDFRTNLRKLRKLAPVTTVCMHGSPRSPWDSRDIWKDRTYTDLGITFEPYLDTDWNDCFYLTDTGRRWDGFKVSVRDRIPGRQKAWTEAGLVFHSTDDIVLAALNGKLPGRVMVTTHPQRWTDKPLEWAKELAMQNAKNLVKGLIAK